MVWIVVHSMPHVIVYSEDLDGPTYVGDSKSDQELMKRLNAEYTDDGTWSSSEPARIVLDKLENEGYKIISSTGFMNNEISSQRAIVWTLRKDRFKEDPCVIL